MIITSPKQFATKDDDLVAAFFLVVAALCVFANLTAYAKQRVIVLTDIENEPDDTQSMIRFLTYSNH